MRSRYPEPKASTRASSRTGPASSAWRCTNASPASDAAKAATPTLPCQPRVAPPRPSANTLASSSKPTWSGSSETGSPSTKEGTDSAGIRRGGLTALAVLAAAAAPANRSRVRGLTARTSYRSSSSPTSSPPPSEGPKSSAPSPAPDSGSSPGHRTSSSHAQLGKDVRRVRPEQRRAPRRRPRSGPRHLRLRGSRESRSRHGGADPRHGDIEQPPPPASERVQAGRRRCQAAERVRDGVRAEHRSAVVPHHQATGARRVVAEAHPQSLGAPVGGDRHPHPGPPPRRRRSPRYPTARARGRLASITTSARRTSSPSSRTPAGDAKSSATDRFQHVEEVEERLRSPSRSVGTCRGLDLDHRGSRPGQQVAAERASPQGREVDHEGPRASPGAAWPTATSTTAGPAASARRETGSRGSRPVPPARPDPWSLPPRTRGPRRGRRRWRLVELEPSRDRLEVLGPRQRHRQPPLAGGQEPARPPAAGGATAPQPINAARSPRSARASRPGNDRPRARRRRDSRPAGQGDRPLSP